LILTSVKLSNTFALEDVRLMCIFATRIHPLRGYHHYGNRTHKFNVIVKSFEKEYLKPYSKDYTLS
jgi:hypothetical protein